MISQKSIQDVLDTARVEEVVEDFVSLKRRGANMIGLCPFHSEKTPSFSVSPSKNIFKCFGCGKGGGPVQFVMEHEQLTFPDAIRYLAKKYQITLEENRPSEEMSEEIARREQLFLINEAARLFFSDQLLNTDLGRNIGLAYFTERGFSRSLVEKFNLGYAPPHGTALKDHLVKLGYPVQELRELGLLSRHDTDFFRDRVIFPLHNISGKVVGFAGRTLKSDKKIPKYINSPETEIYHKSHFLFGAFFAKAAIRKEDQCILVEGYTDVISLHDAGIENVVASSGTALTEEQIRIIKRYTDHILILFDADPAGIKAAMRGIDLILEQDMNVKVLLLPEGEDPDSFVQSQGKEVFFEYSNKQAKDFILFKAGLLQQETHQDPIRKAAVIRDMVSSIARIPDQIKRSLFVQECARIMEISESILINETNKQLRNLIKTSQIRPKRANDLSSAPAPENEPALSVGTAPAQTIPSESDIYQERDLLRIILAHGNKWQDETQSIRIADLIIEKVKPLLDAFDDAVCAKIFKYILESRSAGEEIRINEIIDNQDAELASTAVSLLSSRYEYSENWEEKWRIFLLQKHPDNNEIEDVHQGLLRFQLRKLNKILRQQRERLKQINPEDPDEMIVQLNVYNRMLNQRNEVARALKTTLW